MLPIIVEAAENFCLHQIRLPYTLSDQFSEKRTLLAYIDVETANQETYRTYVGCDETLIQTIAEIFLGEEMSDEQTLSDMLLETTNMIVGSAKVLAGEAYQSVMSIATPFLVSSDEDQTDRLDAVQHINVNGSELTIGIKRL